MNHETATQNPISGFRKTEQKPLKTRHVALAGKQFVLSDLVWNPLQHENPKLRQQYINNDPVKTISKSIFRTPLWHHI